MLRLPCPIILLVLLLSIICFPQIAGFNHVLITLVVVLDDIRVSKEVMQPDSILRENDHQVWQVEELVVDEPSNQFTIDHLCKSQSSAVLGDYADAGDHLAERLLEEMRHQHKIGEIYECCHNVINTEEWYPQICIPDFKNIQDGIDEDL